MARRYHAKGIVHLRVIYKASFENKENQRVWCQIMQIKGYKVRNRLLHSIAFKTLLRPAEASVAKGYSHKAYPI
jgi:hypothetical protein